MTNDQPLIKTNNLTRVYHLGKTEVRALEGVDLRIKDGEFVAITGPSGSGKSTLLHLLGCLDSPTSGQYFLDNVEINRSVNLALIRREKVGFIFQMFNLLPKLSALKNVELPMIYKGIPSNIRHKRAKELLEDVGLGDRINHRPNELSGGQAQRVAIARALGNEPKIIFADEPTGNLDSQSGEEILEELTKLNQKGTTLVVVSHDDYIAKRAGRIIRLLDGRVVEG